MNIGDEEMQNDFERRWQESTPIKDAFRSASDFFGGKAEEPAPKKGFFEEAELE